MPRIATGRGSAAALTLLAACLAAGIGAASVPAESTPQGSQGELKQLSLEQLGDVEVTTASKAPQQVWKTPAAIYVITQDDIRRYGATSIPEALRLAPGVEVARISGNLWSIGIRGFGSRLSRDVLVLIDGRSVYNTLEAGTYWEVQDYVMEDIDRIEVIRGPGGTVWGPNAVNGVINIVTKNSKETPGALVSLASGDGTTGVGSARYGGGNNKGLTYRGYARGFDRGPEYHPDGQNYDSWRSIQGGFRTDWVKSTKDFYTLQGDIYDQGLGENVQLINYAPPYSQTVTGTARLSGGNLLGRWTRTFREGSDIQIQAYYDRTNRRELNFGDLRNTFDVDFLQRFFLGSRNHISWGLGARASHGDELQTTTGLYFTPSSRTDQLDTAFIQDDISLVPNRLTFEAGTKLIHTNYVGLQPEPSGRLLWTPTETQSLWLAVTRAVRTPSDIERDFNLTGFIGTTTTSTGETLPYFARFNANPNFQSEILDGYEAGYRRLVGPNFYIDLATFFNQYYDLFSEDIIGATYLESTPPPPHLLLPADFGNGLQGNTTGGEIAPEWKPVNFLALKGSYSFLHMVLRKGPGSMDVGSAPGIVGSSPQHQALVESNLDLPKNFTVSLVYRYVSALPALSVPSYSTGDARIGWTVARHFEFSVVGRNLFQPRHVESVYDPDGPVGIKRTVFGQLVWRSKEY